MTGLLRGGVCENYGMEKGKGKMEAPRKEDPFQEREKENNKGVCDKSNEKWKARIGGGRRKIVREIRKSDGRRTSSTRAVHSPTTYTRRRFPY
jgi:hypothetical protein